MTANSPRKPKIVIVSSYNRACGIAQYVEFLEIPLRDNPDYHIEVAELPVDILRSQSPYAKTAAKAEFDLVIEKVRDADIVNIQLEPGLLGYSPFQIWQRLKAILGASKRVIITYHTVPSLDSAPLRFSKGGIIQYLRYWRGNYVFDRLFSAIRRNPKKFYHIVQTAREARNFSLLGLDPKSIIHQPLAFLSSSKRNILDHEAAKRVTLDSLKIANGYLIGCFGFLSEYKGIEVALRALAVLPSDHHLLIVGGLHPEGIEKGKIDQPYIKKLTDLIEKIKGLSGRVHFFGALGNDAFNEVMLSCDAVVLPYAEVGQTSSGPAALALDMSRPLYCSHTKCFSELNKFQPGVVSFFQIGNHIELAEKISLQEGALIHHVNARSRYLESYSAEHRAASYLSAATQLMRLEPTT